MKKGFAWRRARPAKGAKMSANEPSPQRGPRRVLAVACAFLLLPGEVTVLAQAPPSASTSNASAAAETATKLPPEQLDSLVAPIALYPDPLLAQALAAPTYPLEIIQLQQWLAKNPTLKDKALADAVAQAALGPRRPVDGGHPRRCQTPRRRHPMDDRPRQRVPRAAMRRHGRRPAHAQEGEGQQAPWRRTSSRRSRQGRRDEAGHRHRAGEAGG